MRVLERVARAEGIETSESALDILARAADGSYRDALGLLDQIATYAGGRVDARDALELLGAVARETIFELVDLMAAGRGGRRDSSCCRPRSTARSTPSRRCAAW